MKKTIAIMSITAVLLGLAACGKKETEPPTETAAGFTAEAALSGGFYEAAANAEGFTPYFWFDAENGSWVASGSIVMDFAVGGTYTETGNTVTAQTDAPPGALVCTLERIDATTLLLKRVETQQGEIPWFLTEGAEYRFTKDPSAPESAGRTPPEETVLSADDALARAKSDGVVVMEGLRCVAGEDAWKVFTDTVAAGEEARVVCAFYYRPDAEQVQAALREGAAVDETQLFFYTLVFDGERYAVTVRQSDRETPETVDEQYRYLLHFTGKGPSGAAFSAYDYWVLTDNDAVTWEAIEAGMVSSRSDDWIRHRMVYANLR